MKSMFSLTLIGVLFSLSCLAGDGVGIGNGGTSKRDEYLSKLREEMGKRISLTRATRVDDLYSWCSKVSRVLRRELQRSNKLLRKLQYQEALLVLEDALIVTGESLNENPELAEPITKILIDRGLFFSEALEQALKGGDELSRLNFMGQYVQFIIDAESNLDRPLYISYHYRYDRCRRGCDGFDLPRFQRTFIEYSRKQLHFVSDNFVHAGSKGRIAPIGNPLAFLKASELMSDFVAGDLRENLYAYVHACAIRDLEGLADDLRAFKNHQNHVWDNIREAVEGTYTELKSIESEIDYNQFISNSCSRNDEYYGDDNE